MYVQICTVYCMVLKTLASYGGREVVTYKCYWNPSSYPQHPKIKVSGKTVMKCNCPRFTELCKQFSVFLQDLKSI